MTDPTPTDTDTDTDTAAAGADDLAAPALGELDDRSEDVDAAAGAAPPADATTDEEPAAPEDPTPPDVAAGEEAPAAEPAPGGATPDAVEADASPPPPRSRGRRSRAAAPAEPADRVRTRARRARGAAAEVLAEAEEPLAAPGRRRRRVADPFAVEADEPAAAAADEAAPPLDQVGADAVAAAAEAIPVDEEPEAEDAAVEDAAVEDGEAPAAADEEGAGRRRRRRGGRGRGRRGRGQDAAGDGSAAAADDTAGDAGGAVDEEVPQVDPGTLREDDEDAGEDADRAEAADDGDDADGEGGGRRRRRRGRRGRGRRTGAGEDGAEGEVEVDAPAPTRLSARAQRSVAGRRRVPTVSAETRRAVAESPPKRMLVTVGAERTQIAVLEERTLVEHYVTQASEASYVGNIYKGRVQNVLPGMEAAFVDIGKGRNGVLYAGEVNYDEADRDGGLPRIEQALKPGQTVLVQVTKDPMGSKGARLTQHLSLAGRYCVLAPGDDMLGISRKLPDDQRERLRKVLKDLKPEGFGLIVRTAAETATAEQLQADVERLVERWAKVEERAAAAKPLEPIYIEPQLVLRVIRDVFGPEHTQLIIDDGGLAEEVREYLREVSPEHVDKVVTYEGEDRLFDAYEVTTQIRRALEKKVWLKSGGYLIIEKTEAMWVIDVNTGKFVGKDNLEETVLRNNLEAAEEIAKQLRLRDMGGIIVIDFVDMIVPANRDEVLKRFKRELARDKTKSRVMEISKLGLVQMTRKNVSKGLMESFTEETDDVIPGRRIVPDLLA